MVGKILTLYGFKLRYVDIINVYTVDITKIIKSFLQKYVLHYDPVQLKFQYQHGAFDIKILKGKLCGKNTFIVQLNIEEHQKNTE